MADNVTRLRDLEARAEDAYGRMYDAPSPTAAAGCYSQAKEAFADAIGLAGRLHAAGDVARLIARLSHVKAVYRSQFT